MNKKARHTFSLTGVIYLAPPTGRHGFNGIFNIPGFVKFINPHGDCSPFLFLPPTTFWLFTTRETAMRTVLFVIPCLLGQVNAIYNPLIEYAGSTFFDKFSYYGNVDNTTWGENECFLTTSND